MRPELAKLDITRRKKVRETLLVDSALAISAYVAIARKMHDREMDLSILERLGEPVTVTIKTAAGDEQREVDLFSRENPIWEQIGVLVPSRQKSGQKVFTLRNARQTRGRDAEDAGGRARFGCSTCSGGRRVARRIEGRKQLQETKRIFLWLNLLIRVELHEATVARL